MSSFNKFKTNSYCIGGRHYSGINNVRGVVSAKGTKMLKRSCAMCRRNKSMTVSDATIKAEGLKDLKVLVEPQLTLERKLLKIQ